jgi:hypothetical protein
VQLGHPIPGGQHPGAHIGGHPGAGMMQGMHPGVSGPQVIGPMVTGMPPGPGTPAPGGLMPPTQSYRSTTMVSTLAPKMECHESSPSAEARVWKIVGITSDDGTIRHKAKIPRTTRTQQSRQSSAGKTSFFGRRLHKDKPTDGRNKGSGGFDSPAPAGTNGSSMVSPMMHDNGISATGFSQQSPATPAFTMSGQQTMRTPTIEYRRVSRSQASPSGCCLYLQQPSNQPLLGM